MANSKAADDADQARESDVNKRALKNQPSSDGANASPPQKIVAKDSEPGSETVPNPPQDANPSATNTARTNESQQRRQSLASRQATSTYVIKTLKELNSQTDSDCFAQLVGKDKLRTKQGKPYYKVTFRDKTHSAQALIWNDSALFEECDSSWTLGDFFKIRATIHSSKYGPKLEIRKARLTCPGDEENGFDPDKCRPTSLDSAENIFSEIVAIANKRLGKGPLLQTVLNILKDNRLKLLELGASKAHHRSYSGGLLEHTLSVLKISIMIADHFTATFPILKGSLSTPLIVAGAILHDVGQIGELEPFGGGFRKTTRGKLVGHAVIGAEILRRYADASNLDPQTACKLEHLILTHSRFAEWGSPTPPASLEAMVLHYADYADSTFASALTIIAEDNNSDDFTLRKGPFDVAILKP